MLIYIRNSIMAVQKQKCTKYAYVVFLLCCGSYGQCITIATNLRANMADNSLMCYMYIPLASIIEVS